MSFKGETNGAIEAARHKDIPDALSHLWVHEPAMMAVHGEEIETNLRKRKRKEDFRFAMQSLRAPWYVHVQKAIAENPNPDKVLNYHLFEIDVNDVGHETDKGIQLLGHQYHGNIVCCTFACSIMRKEQADIDEAKAKAFKPLIAYYNKHGDFPDIVIVDLRKTSNYIVDLFDVLDQIHRGLLMDYTDEAGFFMGGRRPMVISFANDPLSPHREALDESEDDIVHIEDIDRASL